MASIRNRMILFVLAGGGLLLAAGTTFLQSRIQQVLEQGFDGALVAKVSVLATLVRVEPRSPIGLEMHFGEEFMPEFIASEEAEYFQLQFSDGQLIELSESLLGKALELPAGGTTHPRIVDLVLPDGRLGRAVELDFIPENEGPDFGPWLGDNDEEVVAGLSSAVEDFDERFPEAGVTLILARSRSALDEDLRVLHYTTGLVGLAILLGLGLVLLRAGRMVSEPLEAIGRDLAAIDPDSIASRIEGGPYPGEIVPLVGQLNSLLERVEQGFKREKRFSSDVAHELRSPVTKLRLMAEVASMDPSLSAEQAEVFEDFDQAARRLESIVHGLLLISRAESGGVSDAVEALDVGHLIEAVASDMTKELALAGKRLELKGTPGETWVVDVAHFRIALRNLLDNAIAHGSVDAPIRVSWGHTGGAGYLRVQNGVEGLEAGELEHFFDRFWRKDLSRPSDGHFGLGLSIVRAVCELVGWRVRASIPEPGQLEVELSGLPLAPSVELAQDD